MKFVARQLALAALAIGVVTSGAKADVELISAFADGSTNPVYQVGATFEIDTYFSGHLPDEAVQKFETYNFQSSGFVRTDAETSSSFTNELTTTPLAFKNFYVATAPGDQAYYTSTNPNSDAVTPGFIQTNYATYNDVTSNELFFTIAPAVSAVPEASTWVMMLTGFVSLGAFGLQRRRRSGVSAFA